MSRSVSAGFKEAVFAQETGEVFLILVTITHTDLPDPIRVVNNSENINSRGQTFIAYPFEITLPTDTENGNPRATLKIDNVDREIVRAVRTIQTAPTVTLEIVMASDPDVVEIEFPDFQLQDVNYNSLTVEGTLGLEQFLAEPFPGDLFSPANFPGLF